MELELFSLIAREDISGLSDLIETAPFNPFTIKDSKQSNLFHIAALKNSVPIASLLVDFAQRRFAEFLVPCLHEQNSDGFTCLLYAAFKGNLVRTTQTLIELFVTHGASMDTVTNLGTGFMHAAAQGNHLVALVYGYQAGLSPVPRDSRGATPLHWAAHLNCSAAASYLLHVSSEVDPVDVLEQTPLHVATARGHKDIARTLLVKGANLNAHDECHRRPLDIAADGNAAGLAELLQEPGLLNYCGLRLPQRPVTDRQKTSFAFLLFIFILLALDITFVFHQELWYYILAGVHFGLFTLVACSNPGKIKPSAGTTLLKLAQTYQANTICVECTAARPRRAVHCSLCKACVARFDHHCPLTNNCIGARNFGLYFAYLWLGLVFFAATTWLNYAASVNDCAAFVEVPETVCESLAACLLFLCGLCGLFFGWLVMIHSRSLTSRRTYYERVYEIPQQTSGGCIEMCCGPRELNTPLLPYGIDRLN